MTKLNVTIEKSVIEKVERYRFGTFFLDTESQKVYILALITYTKACLISLSDGNRFSCPIEVTQNIGYHILADDLVKVTDNQPNRFVEIENIEIKVF